MGAESNTNSVRGKAGALIVAFYIQRSSINSLSKTQSRSTIEKRHLNLAPGRAFRVPKPSYPTSPSSESINQLLVALMESPLTVVICLTFCPSSLSIQPLSSAGVITRSCSRKPRSLLSVVRCTVLDRISLNAVHLLRHMEQTILCFAYQSLKKSSSSLMPGFYRKIPKRRHSVRTRNALFRPYGPNRLTLDMPVNKFCLMIAVMIGANLINPPARTNTI